MVSRERIEGVRILAMLREIVSADSGDRARAADAAPDLIQEYSDSETLTLTFAVALQL